MGLSRVAPTMVGQNLGAGQPDRAQRAADTLGRVATVISVVVLGVLAALALWKMSSGFGTLKPSSESTRMMRTITIC